ncbi:PREDICTED: uncharacterized protein LOC109214423 [Nicotiana attenuata]|uniref:TMEM205-like domain-containing protein n=1 Tax=Nicotiana attenuata TaxID=49451 RepID=A0A1J6KWI6_NICAT|nr:PREDICTED: uncharacterized protein LOC109214423 [Nicotiana attenuata]OIT27099.1 hypothetical protein A4A49_25406 [Nicotiana attenuata]
MMNIFAITLVLTTLVTAGVFSPIPEKKEEVIVKEGHRVVVVEYEPNDGNTKVSISPQETDQKTTAGVVSGVKDKISDTAETVKDKIKEATSFGEEEGKENGGVHKPTARELVCDAFGKCKHRIASALGGTKDTVSGKMHETEEDAKETVENVYDKVKDTVVGKAHEASVKASEVKEKSKDVVEDIVEEVKEGAKETAEKVREKAKDVGDITGTLKGDVKRNASQDLDYIEEKAKAAKDAVKEDANRLKVEGKRDNQVIRRFFFYVSEYIVSDKNFRSLMGMVHFLGFALAYGVCIWVTFISSNILARAMPKQQFAMVQSKIYPVYFKTMTYGVATAFFGHFMSQRHRYYYANRAETIQGFLFLASICTNLINSFVLEPRSSKVMTERIKLEKEEGKGKDIFSVEPSTSSVDALKDPTGIKSGKEATSSEGPAETHQELSEEAARVKPQVEKLSQKLKKLNVVSSFFNGLTLMALSYHLVHLSQLVHATSY